MRVRADTESKVCTYMLCYRSTQYYSLTQFDRLFSRAQITRLATTLNIVTDLVSSLLDYVLATTTYRKHFIH